VKLRLVLVRRQQHIYIIGKRLLDMCIRCEALAGPSALTQRMHIIGYFAGQGCDE
jgi:hypothetical protein